MNENLNLCEILKGHEGETFYSPICGTIVLLRINSDDGIIFKSLLDPCVPYAFNEDGTFISGAECVILPSKDQRDWNKWIEEQKPKVPKTWSEYIESEYYEWDEIYRSLSMQTNPIYISMFAFLKIHQLIDAGYGGNVTEWEYPCVDKYIITPTLHIEKVHYKSFKSHLAFHTKEQAEEFLSKPENVRLLEDYYVKIEP